MCRWLLLAMVAAGALHAAVIRGTVVENQSGHPLAHALVEIEPLSGTPGGPQSMRSNRYGAFEFPPLAGGAYLVSASRRAFAPLQYGQKRWKAAGVPVVVDEAGNTTLTIRMSRFGAITGSLLDQNDVGLPEHDVVAYRNTRPPQVAARGKTDDRGRYRVYGLEPGSYLIRTVARDYDEGSYLPTFAPQFAAAAQARPVDVVLDRDTPDANVRPAPGRLFRVGGRALVVPRVPVTLTLVSDMGTQTTTSEADGRFEFKPEAPGRYEIYAQAPGNRVVTAGFQALSLDGDRSNITVTLAPFPMLDVRLVDTRGEPVDARAVRVMARRKDLAAEGKPEVLRPKEGGTSMMPGRWELSVAPSADYYVARFSGGEGDGERAGRGASWNEVLLTGSGTYTVSFTLAPHPGGVHGVVKAEGSAAPGAPVHLEAYDPDNRRRVADLRTVRADTRGAFHFGGLAPGLYRILGSFEFSAPESADFDGAGAGMFRIDEGRDESLDLELYVIR